MTTSLSQLITLLIDPVFQGFMYRKELSTLQAVKAISSPISQSHVRHFRHTHCLYVKQLPLLSSWE